MSPDIERAIEQLEAKIAELTSARDTLIETFDPPDSPRRRLVLARRASFAERARKRGEGQSSARAAARAAAAAATTGHPHSAQSAHSADPEPSGSAGGRAGNDRLV